MDNSEFNESEIQRKQLERDVMILRANLADVQSRIKMLEAQLYESKYPVSFDIPPQGALGGHAKTIGELNYKTVGEIYNQQH